MMMNGGPRELEGCAFFEGLNDDAMTCIQNGAKVCHFPDGAWIARQGEPADDFYLIRDGRVAVVFPAPLNELTIQTLSSGDVLGWSWLMPPHEWQFDIRAVKDCELVSIDGRILRTKCEQDPRLGYTLTKRLSHVIAERLQAARLQLMDLYGQQQ